MKYRFLLTLGLILVTLRPASAGPILDWLLAPYGGHHGINNPCPLPCCPDDYHCKPMPCVACPPPCTLPDDYHCKPMPCVACPPKCTLPDDYCVKPLPCLFCLPQSPFLSCGTPDGCHGPACGAPK